MHHPSARMDCILCGESVRTRFAARDYRRLRDEIKYPLAWCGACDFGRLVGDFTPERVSDFYRIPYYTHGIGNSAQRRQTFLERLRVHLAWRCDRGIAFDLRELGLPNGRTVCDIGCGGGSLLEMLRKAGFKVTGVEPDAEARRMASKVNKVFNGSAERLPEEIRSCRFDIILMWHVLEHCIDPLAALDNCAAILRPGGVLVVEVPNNAAKGFDHFGPAWAWADIPRHINFFTARSLEAMLEKRGFTVNMICYSGYTRQFLPDWIDSQVTIAKQLSIEDGQPDPWKTLALTAFAPREQKYDSVRIHASRRAS